MIARDTSQKTGKWLPWRLVLVVLSAGVALSMGTCQCGGTPRDEGLAEGEVHTVLLAGGPQQFDRYSRVAERQGQSALVVGGIIGDLPGASDALDSLRAAPLASGRLTIVPRANAEAIRRGERGDLSDAFGPEVSPAQRALVTTLQAMADTSDVLIVVTDMVDDVGNSILYSPDAPVTTVAIAQQIAGAINRRLESVGRATGIAFDEFYALRSSHPNSFVGWAGGRAQPALALEFALFGGRDPDLSVRHQMILARLAVTVALAELGILEKHAPDRIAFVSRDRAANIPEARYPDAPGLRYVLDGEEGVHVPGELWALPETGSLRLVGFHGGMFDGMTADLAGIGGDDDVGRTVALGDLPGSGDRIIELRYVKNGRLVWKEPVLVGELLGAKMFLQDTLGTNPWVAGFPPSESWLYLAEHLAPDGLPATLLLVRGRDRTIVGRGRTLRNYHLELDGLRVGELFVTRWRDEKNTHLVDITEINDRFGLSPGIAVDMRYATEDNFLHANVYDGINRCLLKERVAEALARVQQTLAAKGLGLKVWDCYRPHPVQYRMWRIRPEAGYVAPPGRGSNHNRGAAVDATLVDAQGRELTMPTGYDNFTERAWQATTAGLSEEQLRNKRTLREAMTAQGFSPIRKEWWHYDGPNHRSYTTNLDVPLATGYERMPFPKAWAKVRVVAR